MSVEATIPPIIPPSAQPTYLTTMYAEVCRSHQALQDFRMKLLGLLPIASIAALLALGKSASGSSTPLETIVVGYIGVFSALFTLALFGYEARGILMCHDLSSTGAALEELMKIDGQYRTCDESRNLPCYGTKFKQRLARKINDKIAPCAIYSLVFTAWFFVALRFVFEVELAKCALCAGGAGLAITILTSWGLQRMTASPKHPRAIGLMEVAT